MRILMTCASPWVAVGGRKRLTNREFGRVQPGKVTESAGSQPAWPLRACNRIGLLLLERSLAVPTFPDLGVSAPVARRLNDMGVSHPLPIQVATIPDALAGRDVCGQAPTGSGKTLAFGVPLVASTAGSLPGRPRALVIVPTRELADQVRDVLSNLMGPASNRVVAVYGGTGYELQRKALRRGVDIVVACPGRLEDLVTRDVLQLGEVQTVVLDEADRMVDMGFVRPVCRLLDRTAEGRQVLMFSATMGPEVSAISRRYQRHPAQHHITTEASNAPDVTHHFWRAERAERVTITAELIDRHGQAFVFCRTKRGVDRVARQLRAAGVEAAPMHGDRSQPQRTRALATFAGGKTHALVATDVVARGIHVQDVPCVVHFDPAGDADSYVHRSGRTGRAGSPGTVVSLVSDDVAMDVRGLQRALGLPGELTLPFADGVSTTTASAQPPRSGPGRRSGTVKFFDSKRGYGFLSVPDGTEVFIHHSKVEPRGTGRTAFRKGEQVDFELVIGRRGPEAHMVTVADAVAS